MKAIFSALLLGALISLPALSQDAWPTKPLRVVIPYPAGSPDDTIARLIAPSLKQSLNQPILVENRPGAGGNIGAQEVIRSTDEHTVLFGTDTILTINPHIYRKLPFNSAEDLVPVTLLASFSQMLVCNPSVGVKTAAELVAKSKAERITYASGGPGVPVDRPTFASGHVANIAMPVGQAGQFRPSRRSGGCEVAALVRPTPLTLRTYCSAAAVTSASVAGGSRPRRMVMFRHMRPAASRAAIP